MIYFDKPHNRIELNEAEGWVEIAFLGFVSEPELDESHAALNKLMAERKPWAMIVDARKASALNHAMQQKSMANAAGFAARGLRYVAVIEPQRETTRISLETMKATTTASGLMSAFFNEKDTAIEWLRRQKPQK